MDLQRVLKELDEEIEILERIFLSYIKLKIKNKKIVTF